MIKRLIRKGVLRLVGPIEVVAPPNPDNADLAARVTALEAQLSLSERHHTLSFWAALDKVYDIALQDRVISCIVCGNSSKRDSYEILTSNCIFGGGKLERYRCPHCDCVFGAQKFLDQGEDMIGLDYELLYSRYKEGNTVENEMRTFHSLSPTTEGAYVNWGCGAWNNTVPRLRSDSWNVWGFEPSAGVASEFVISQKDALPSKLDGLFSNNVIEHFLNPVAEFKKFADLLPPGGRMAHSSPCYEYRYEITRFHTVFLLGRSPEVLAERSGFRVIDRIKDGEYINVVFEKV